MFFWDYKGIYILLTDEEEMSLVRELSGNNSVEIVGYNASREIRKKYEKQIFAYLKSFLLSNPEEFNKKYVFRSWYNDEARKIFPHFLKAYGFATKLATFGNYGSNYLSDDLPEKVIYLNAEVYHITFLSRKIFPSWSKPKPTGGLSFPALSVEKLTGTVDNFVFMTNQFDIRFGREFIRISILGRAA